MKKLEVISACEGCSAIFSGQSLEKPCPNCGCKLTMAVSGSYVVKALFTLDALECLRNQVPDKLGRALEAIESASARKKTSVLVCSNN